MKSVGLALLRFSLGLLMIFWGLDKLVNLDHSLEVSAKFYSGFFNSAVMLQSFGVAQVLLGVGIAVGFGRRFAYPALLLITGATLIGVWRSIVDPWGWVLEGGSILFYPSLIIFSGSLVLWASQAEDVFAVDQRRHRNN